MICSWLQTYSYLLMSELDMEEFQLGQACVLAVGLFLVVSCCLILQLIGGP
jgi:hypothetical protein